MIHTSKQLKDKVRNISKSDPRVAQALLRNFIMERFLERVSVSKYKDRFILKGGMLVASIVGVDMRATMDIDATIRALPLNIIDTKQIIEEICSITIEDEVTFRIIKASEIMSDFEYSGVRVHVEAKLDRLCQPIKIDISTNDVITPSAIKYQYPLMFEERAIELLTYNIETLLAEKIQAIFSRGVANTRMRDYYDVYMIVKNDQVIIAFNILKDAFRATCLKRNTVFDNEAIIAGLSTIKGDSEIKERWGHFRKENFFVGDVLWEDALRALDEVMERISL